MRFAINLAKKAEGMTWPNPMVGAVILKGNKIIGRGFHKRAGEPHAEINALMSCRDDVKESALILNLEPCNHFGRTGPCTDAILKSGIKRVVIGMLDPNPMVNGKGVKILRAKGIDVRVGILEEECRKLNEVYIKNITIKKPYIILKVASTIDGKISTKNSGYRWITNETSRNYVHKLRSIVDGILVGIGTVLKDDPLLTPRLNRKINKKIYRIILDSSLRIPLNAKVLKVDENNRTIIATLNNVKKNKISILEKMGVDILKITPKNGMVDIEALIERLWDKGISCLLIEGGGGVFSSAMKSNIVDKLIFFIAPKIFGSDSSLDIFPGFGFTKVEDAVNLRGISVKRLNDDIMVEGYLKNWRTETI